MRCGGSGRSGEGGQSRRPSGIESTHDLSEQQQRGHNHNKGYFEQLE